MQRYRLYEKIHDYKLLAVLFDIKNNKILSKEEEKKLVIEAKQNNKIAINKLVESNLRRALNLSYKFYASTTINLEDIFSDCMVGILKAIKKYDLNSDMRFSNYAYYWMRAEINDDLRKMSRYKNHNISYEELLERKSYEYLDINIMENLENMGSICIFSNEFDAEKFQEYDELVPMLKKLRIIIDTLSPMEQDIIKLYFGFDSRNFDKMTFKTIGNKYSLSKQRVHQIYTKSLNKLRCSIKENDRKED